jgi:hypothetical protein
MKVREEQTGRVELLLLPEGDRDFLEDDASSSTGISIVRMMRISLNVSTVVVSQCNSNLFQGKSIVSVCFLATNLGGGGW